MVSSAVPSISSDYSIGIYSGNSPYNLTNPTNVFNPVLTARDVTDVPATGVADPFMVFENNTWYMFFEVVVPNAEEAIIGVATSNDGLHWFYRQIVLRENFHTAYPYVFKWQNDYYMIPDTYSKNSIRLYKAINFPYQWEFIKSLVEGPGYLDASVVNYNNRWWLFTSVPSNDKLYLFYADNLLGPWTSHKLNPIISGNSDVVRLGGRIVNYNGVLLRHAQDDNPTYGNDIHVFEITNITTTSYSEREISGSPFLKESGIGWNSEGMHNVDPVQIANDNWIACVDGFGDPYYNPLPNLIPKTNWTLLYVDSQETVGENGAGTNAFDSSNATIWHTQYIGGNPPPPHEIQIDLGGNYMIEGFQYLPRQDGSVNGRIGQYQFYVSTGLNWGSPVASGTFANSASEKDVHFSSVPGRYVRLRALTEINGNPWISAAEIGVMGTVTVPEHAPAVSSTSPQNQATGVAVNSGIAATFSKLMDTSTITMSTFTVSNGVNNIAGNISFTSKEGKTTAIFSPSSNLSPGTTYTVTITTGVMDLSGNPMAQNYSWSFTTGPAPDLTPPTVFSTGPTDGASSVWVGSSINVIFSEAMATSTITAATFDVSGGGGYVTGNIGFATSSGKTVATLTPSSSLLYGVKYTGTITTGVRDLAGNAMAQNYIWTFTTTNAPDTTPPTVISTVPDANITGVSRGAPITVTFSETMDTASFTPNAFILTGGGSNIAYSVNASGATAIFTPSVQLAYSTVYTATVTTFVRDQAGNNIALNKTWSFTTEMAPSGGGGGGGGGCSVSPTRKPEEQSNAGIILVLLSPVMILVVRKIIR